MCIRDSDVETAALELGGDRVADRRLAGPGEPGQPDGESSFGARCHGGVVPEAARGPSAEGWTTGTEDRQPELRTATSDGGVIRVAAPVGLGTRPAYPEGDQCSSSFRRTSIGDPSW